MTCQHEEIVGPGWPLSSDLVRSFFERLATSSWLGEAPGRFGFVDPELWDGTVAMGYFAVEKPLQIVTYDNSKERTEHEEESFEHVWFALFLDDGRLLSQRRKFIHKALNSNKVLELMKQSIARELVALDLPVLQIRPVEKVVEKSEFLTQFERGGVKEVRIDQLTDSRVPATTKLFNPDVDRDAILKETINHDNHHVREIAAKASEQGDLSATRFFKGEMAAGQPSLMVREEDHEVITLHRTTPDRLQFGVHMSETRVIPTDEEKALIVGTVKGRRIKRRKSTAGEGQTELFQSDQETDDERGDGE